MPFYRINLEPGSNAQALVIEANEDEFAYDFAQHVAHIFAEPDGTWGEEVAEPLAEPHPIITAVYIEAYYAEKEARLTE